MVHRLIPKVTYANHATLARAVIIERGEEFVEALHHEQAVETFVKNAEDAYGFPPYPILADSLSRWNGEDLASCRASYRGQGVGDHPHCSSA